MDDQNVVLIVDDTPENLQVLGEMLEQEGCQVRIATNGAQALQNVKISPPDLILLDIMMPGMDGYEVCRRLKADPDLSKIPVIFISALDLANQKVLAFREGAVDYVAKPFHSEEVVARVRTHLELKQYRDRLEKLAEERAKQLVHAERLAVLGTLSAGVAHEIRNPLSFIQGGAELMEIRLDTISPGTPIDQYLQDLRKNIDHIKEGVSRIVAIIDAMRSFSRKDSDSMVLVDVGACIDMALRLCSNIVKRHQIVYQPPATAMPRIMGRAQQLEQVFVNLLQNASDAMGDMHGGRLEITPVLLPDSIRITIQDNGPGIPEDKLEEVWAPFYTTKGEDKGTGLGLAISRGIIEEHHGSIQVRNNPLGGAEFIIELPLPEESK